jgi:ATP-dependent DNA helicase RecG
MRPTPAKEHQTVEWKQNWRDEYLKWICAFANSDGGTLCIGKNDQGVVVGLPNAKALLEEIPNKVRDLLGMVVPVRLRREKGLEWLEIAVEAYPSPISYKGEYHVRSGSTKQELKGQALEAFLLRKRGHRWDGVPLPGLGVKDCSKAALQLFKDRSSQSGRLHESVLKQPPSLLLENLQLSEGRYLRQAAALLFLDQPERFVPGAFIKIGFFVSNHDLRYQDEVHGNLFSQVESTLELLYTKWLFPFSCG